MVYLQWAAGMAARSCCPFWASKAASCLRAAMSSGDFAIISWRIATADSGSGDRAGFLFVRSDLFARNAFLVEDLGELLDRRFQAAI
jgi:hypothetical protein